MPAAASEEKAQEETFMNLVNTVVTPIDLRKSDVVFGAAEYIFFEVFTSWMIRYVMGFEKRPLTKLLAIHAISIPMIGGTTAFMNPNHIMGYEAPWGDVLLDGGKGVPAVFLAQYLVNTSLVGFHAPSIAFKEVLITIASKVLSRVLVSVIYSSIPGGARSYLDILEEVFFKQNAVSRLKQD